MRGIEKICESVVADQLAVIDALVRDLLSAPEKLNLLLDFM
jgi:hypothetical protein